MVRTHLLFAMAALAILAGCGGGTKHTNPPVAAAAQGVQVTLEAPRMGSVSNPLNIQASAASPNGISGWVVYVDNNAVLRMDNHQDTISTTVPLASGAHLVYVRAWDQVTQDFGTSTSIEVTANGSQAEVAAAPPVSTATAPASAAPSAPPAPSTPSAPAPSSSSTQATPPPPPPSPLPNIPGDAKIWNDIQNMDGWEKCSACAGGQASTDNFWTAGWESSPSQTGSSREFFIGGPPWASALWIKKLGQQNWAAHFLWDFWVRFDPTTANNAWTAEYDLWQSVGGREYMIGSHCNFGENRWEIWDSANWSWVPTDIFCPRFSPDSWHHIQWYAERWGSRYHYGILIVDGEVHNLDRTFDTNPIDWPDQIGVQWQLDQDGSGAPLHEWVDNVKLAIW